MESRKKGGDRGGGQQHRGRGRGRGGGDRGARPQTAVNRDDQNERGDKKSRGDRGKERPQTARGGQRDRGAPIENRDRDNRRGGRGRGGKGQADEGGVTMHGAGAGQKRSGPPFDESSWQWKYRNAERPVLDYDLVVKIDTKIPALPAPNEYVKKPNKDAFHQKMKDLDKKAEDLKVNVESNRFQRNRVYEGGKVDGGDVTYRDLILSNIEEVKKVRAKHKEHLDQLRDLKERQGELESEKTTLMKNIPRNYHTYTDLQHAIQDKQERYETSSMYTNAEERKLLREIDQLKKALPDMKKLETLEPELAQIREKRKTINKELDVVKKILDEKNEKINIVKNQSEAQRNKKSEVRDAAEKYTVLIEKDNEELTKIYKTKDGCREDYYKAMYQHEVQSEYIRYVRGLMSQQKKLIAQSDERQKRIEQKKMDIESRPSPHQKEIETCDDLIKYCNKLKAQAGLVPPSSEQVAQQAQNDFLAEQRRAELDQKLKDGKILAANQKKDDLLVVGGGGGKGKKGKKQKSNQNKQDAQQSSTFEIDFYQIKMFALVRLSPPLGPEGLDEKIDELKKKKLEFTEEGEKLLKDQNAELEDMIEQEVDAELERERRAEEGYDDEDDYYDEDETYKEDAQEPAKTAPSSKNDNRGKTQKATENERKQPDSKKKKFSKFDDSDDEDQKGGARDPYSKPSRGGGKQVNQDKKGKGKQQMNLDDDEDFPAL